MLVDLRCMQPLSPTFRNSPAGSPFPPHPAGHDRADLCDDPQIGWVLLSLPPLGLCALLRISFRSVPNPWARGCRFQDDHHQHLAALAWRRIWRISGRVPFFRHHSTSTSIPLHGHGHDQRVLRRTSYHRLGATMPRRRLLPGGFFFFFGSSSPSLSPATFLLHLLLCVRLHHVS